MPAGKTKISAANLWIFVNTLTSLTSRTATAELLCEGDIILSVQPRNQWNMFESLVASILNGILGKYIKDLDSSNLNLGILNGEKTYDLYRIRSSSTNKTS